jgi:hypothetical protein
VDLWRTETGLFSNNMQSVWASGPTDVFVAGGVQGISHFDGTSWTAQSNSFGFNRYRVFGTGPTDVFVTGQSAYQAGVVGHYDGSTWTPILTTGDELTAGFAFSPTSVVVGGDGTLRKYDGNSWTSIATGLSPAFNTDRITSIWGTSADDFFAVGYNGIFFHYTGGTLTSRPLPGNLFISCLQGLSGSDIYGVGENGAIWHFDGSNWTAMSGPTTERLDAVYAISANDVYAGGVNGTMLHYDGVLWSQFDVGTSHTITGLFAVSPDVVYASIDGPGAVLIGTRSVVTTTPEPASLALFAGGLLFVIGVTRRKVVRTR